MTIAFPIIDKVMLENKELQKIINDAKSGKVGAYKVNINGIEYTITTGSYSGSPS